MIFDSSLEIKGFIPNTMIDWEGMIASTIFLPGCNFRCPFCQNRELVLLPDTLPTVPPDMLEDFFIERKGWIDGVCVTGGEPCFQPGIEKLLEWIKDLGLKVKLDTNGSFPDVLRSLIDQGLLDFIAMDLKAPFDAARYRIASGNRDSDLVERIQRSIDILRSSGLPHEFRTTVVPMIHSPEDIESIAKSIAGDEDYVLQRFSPKTTIDPRYSKLEPYREEDLKRALERAKKYVKRVRIRGAPMPVNSP